MYLTLRSSDLISGCELAEKKTTKVIDAFLKKKQISFVAKECYSPHKQVLLVFSPNTRNIFYCIWCGERKIFIEIKEDRVKVGGGAA